MPKPYTRTRMNRYLVIISGGRGERFWPVSRLTRPKQLLPIVGDTPMLAQTLERVGDLVPPENIFIITNIEQRDACIEVAPQVPAEQIVGEPMGRDTAAAVALAALLVERKDPQGVFSVLPADAVIHDAPGFRGVLSAAYAEAAQEDVLVTIGIQPDNPATGYGYLQRGEQAAEAEGQPVYKVKRFVEKPDLPTAEEYLASGDYFWNAGMFVWSVPSLSKALGEHVPGLLAAVKAIGADLDSGTPLDEALAGHYPGLEKISIDYALMERPTTWSACNRLSIGMMWANGRRSPAITPPTPRATSFAATPSWPRVAATSSSPKAAT
ncbi:MAG: mannose-1-phosphate guanylyltransferase [Verrucomicrobiota bacterium]